MKYGGVLRAERRGQDRCAYSESRHSAHLSKNTGQEKAWFPVSLTAEQKCELTHSVQAGYPLELLRI